MKFKILLLVLVFFIFSFFVLFYKKNNTNLNDIRPVNLDRTHMCASDSMIIVDYKGPKAQILWKDGKRSYYCEVREAFYESTDSIIKKNIKAFFVQDFSNLNWDSYFDKWILADNAYYVIDSNKDGAMGLTYVPFSDINAAKKFLNDFGGKLINYNDIDKTVLSNSSNILKDRIIF